MIKKGNCDGILNIWKDVFNIQEMGDLLIYHMQSLFFFEELALISS